MAILREGRFFCSGSLVSSTTVVTAAHCASGVPAAQLSVVAGRTRVRRGGGQVIGVGSTAVHPDFGFPPVHDVAVLRLTGPASAPTIPLASPAEDAAVQPGASVSVAGFGEQNPLVFGRSRVGVLKSAPLLARSGCGRPYGVAADPTLIVCASGDRLRGVRRGARRSACFGDSGGPVVSWTGAGPRLVAVVSGGASKGFILCGGVSGLYARVGPDLAFINGATGAGPVYAPIFDFTGPAKLKPRRRVAFPMTCAASCSVAITMHLILPGRDRGPIPFAGTLAPGQTLEAFVRVNRFTRFRLLRGGSLKTDVTVTDTGTGQTETHSRLFGFPTEL